jgi:hypothetical protein
MRQDLNRSIMRDEGVPRAMGEQDRTISIKSIISGGSRFQVDGRKRSRNQERLSHWALCG